MEPSVVTAPDHTARPGWQDRLRAAGIHLGLSVLVAALAGTLVFLLWYPYPYREVSGGRELFQLVVAVDVVLGPLITLAIFDRAKAWPVLRRDLVVVAAVQLAGLGYGLWTVEQARPIHLVFEIDRFRVVHAVDVPEELAGKAPPEVRVAPLGGPTLLSLRAFRDQKESMEATLAALQGLPLSARPELWQPYEAGRADVLRAAAPVAELKARFPQRVAEIDAALQRAGRDTNRTLYLPMMARKTTGWTVLVDAATADVVGFLPLDSF